MVIWVEVAILTFNPASYHLLCLPLFLHHITRYVAMFAFSRTSYYVTMFICIPASYYVTMLAFSLASYHAAICLPIFLHPNMLLCLPIFLHPNMLLCLSIFLHNIMLLCLPWLLHHSEVLSCIHTVPRSGSDSNQSLNLKHIIISLEARFVFKIYKLNSVKQYSVSSVQCIVSFCGIGAHIYL